MEINPRKQNNFISQSKHFSIALFILLLSIFFYTNANREVFIVAITFTFFWSLRGWNLYSIDQKIFTAISGTAFLITKAVLDISPYFGIMTIFLFPVLTQIKNVNNVQLEVSKYRTLRTIIVIIGIVIGYTI